MVKKSQSEKKKTNTQENHDLKGIEAVSSYLNNLQYHDILAWRAHFGLPVYRVNTKNTTYWAANKADLDCWLKSHGIEDPAEITRSYLEEFELRNRETSGKQEKINRKLEGINQIADVCGQSLTTTNDFYKYRDAPIRKENGILVADADQLLAWLIENDLISLHQVEQKRQTWRSVDNYA